MGTRDAINVLVETTIVNFVDGSIACPSRLVIEFGRGRRTSLYLFMHYVVFAVGDHHHYHNAQIRYHFTECLSVWTRVYVDPMGRDWIGLWGIVFGIVGTTTAAAATTTTTSERQTQA